MTSFTIYLGDRKTIFLKAINESVTGDPLDLTNCTEIDIALPLATGEFQHLLLSADKVVITDPPVLGKFSAEILSDVSLLMNPGVGQDLNVTFTINSEVFTVGFVRALNVLQPLSYQPE